MSGYNYFNGSSTENYLAYRDQSLFSALGEGRGGRIFGGDNMVSGQKERGPVVTNRVSANEGDHLDSKSALRLLH